MLWPHQQSLAKYFDKDTSMGKSSNVNDVHESKQLNSVFSTSEVSTDNKFFTILTTDETKAICNCSAKKISRGNKYGIGHDGLKKPLTSHSPTNLKF
uniref:Uncharacterized protein n=1 Tax=Romanomermis culicivorax TaxID=13658 RepID=A0A915HK80_ROMCU